jgi:hypothetical protein
MGIQNVPVFKDFALKSRAKKKEGQEKGTG